MVGVAWIVFHRLYYGLVFHRRCIYYFYSMRTPFLKGLFRKSGIYLNYDANVNQPHTFIARFKYGGPFTMAKFKKELIANHTVEEYLHKLNVERKAPLEILREKNPTWYNQTLEKWKAKH